MRSVVDQNFGRNKEDYRICFVGNKVTLGPEFALLRPEFVHWRAASLERRHAPILHNLLITMGGRPRKHD